MNKYVVLKFGGSVLHSPADFDRIQHEILRYCNDGLKVVAVVSAYFGVTEKLIAEAAAKNVKPNDVEYADLISDGERQSASDLVTYLVKSGLNASHRSPKDLKFFAQGPRDSGTPINISRALIESALASTPIIVVPGYSAIDADEDCILLGRGGSDISAVCIAQALQLDHVRLLKDVDGLYDCDPNKYAEAKKLNYIDYATAQKIGGELIQTEAIVFASNRRICIDIAAIGESSTSRIGPPHSHVSKRSMEPNATLSTR